MPEEPTQQPPGPVHRTVPVQGGRIHCVEQGSGPLVLLVHGFPESWYSWRHQLPVIAAAGYRAVAVDVRGYGRSSKPADVDAYRMLALVGDAVGVVSALGERTAAVIGHDWGSGIAAHAALLRPDVFTAVGMLSVPYTPPGGPRPSEVFAAMGGEEEFYVRYFQQPGRAEAEIEADVRGWLAGCYAGMSGPAVDPALYFVPAGARMADRFPSDGPPAWLTEADLDVYAGEFERTGFAGALNRYRTMDRDWEDLAPWNGAPLTQPSLFICGAADGSADWLSAAIDAFPTTLPGLVSSHLLPDTGHWVQQERPEEVGALLVDWLRTAYPAQP